MKNLFFVVLGILALSALSIADEPVDALGDYFFEDWITVPAQVGTTRSCSVPESPYDDNEFSGSVGVYGSTSGNTVQVKGTFRANGVRVIDTMFIGHPGDISTPHNPYVGPVPENSTMTVSWEHWQLRRNDGTGSHHLVIEKEVSTSPDPDPNPGMD